jgi:hypothetical protein
MRTLARHTVTAVAIAASLSAAAAQDNTPATHRGTGTEISNNYRFFMEDRARMENGAHERAMQAAKENMDAYTTMRAREGRPVTPRR